MNRAEKDDLIERAFESLREVPPPDEARQASTRGVFLARARHYRGLSASAGQAVGRSRRGFLPLNLSLSKGLAMAGVIVAIVFALVAGTGGVIYAADGAAPGDALYPIDQAVESARLSLTSEPGATMELLLSLAEERLLEAEKLTGKGTERDLEVALSGYGATISALAQTLGAVESLDAAALTAQVDQSFSAHEAQWAAILEDADEEESGVEGAAEGCVGVEPHPVAERLAGSYGVPYEQIMSWFCDGDYGFGEIMHALETGQETGVPAADLLVLKTELGGWGRVWQGLGLIGRPEGVPAGPPADRPVGPPEDRPVGPPEDRPVGPSEDKPAGQPEDRPVGPPEDRPVGPPEDKPGGQPEDRPVGPPEDTPGGQPEDRPVGPPADAGPPDDAGPPGNGFEFCVGADSHPRAVDLAETYNVLYDDIMNWFCDGGYGFGDIMLALRTSRETGVPAGELLALKSELQGWGQVWQELGLVGQPDDAPGQSKDKQGGPSEDKGSKRP